MPTLRQCKAEQKKNPTLVLIHKNGYVDNRGIDRGYWLSDDPKDIAIAALPAVFELRAFPGVPLSVDRPYCYVDDNNRMQLILFRRDTGNHFGKGTLDEIKAQIAKEVQL